MSEKKPTRAQLTAMQAEAFLRIVERLEGSSDHMDSAEAINDMANAVGITVAAAKGQCSITVLKEVISNIACVTMHTNMNDFSSTSGPEEQTLAEMEFAIAIKRAIAEGKESIVLEVFE